MSSPHNQPAAAPTPTGSGVSRRWLYLALGVAVLFVLMPFLFWQSTWFGRPLSDEQIQQYLNVQEHPRKAQHALSQIADRLGSRDPVVRASVRHWYPQVVALSASPVDELRLTAAWVMGQDNAAPEFHAPLLWLLADPHPMVQRNAALSLVRFGDASGRPVILAMLEPYTVPAPQPGSLAQRLKVGDIVNPGTLLARIRSGEANVEVRSQVSGTLDRWLAPNGEPVTAGQGLAQLSPSPEMVWEALRALYLVGREEDLPAVERYARGLANMPELVRQQAERTARAIRSRSSPDTP